MNTHHGRKPFYDLTGEQAEIDLFDRITKIEVEMERLSEAVTGLLLGRK